MKAGGANEKNDKKLFSASSRQVLLGYDLRNGARDFFQRPRLVRICRKERNKSAQTHNGYG